MKPTLLEELVRNQTAATVTGAFRIAVEKIAEEIARDILQDKAFRDNLHVMVAQQSQAIMARLLAPNGKGRRKPKP